MSAESKPVRGNAPAEPQSFSETGLPESLVESLILKVLYFRGDVYGRDLSLAIGLKLSVIEDMIEGLKVRHHVQIKKSLGMGNVGAVLALTDAGRSRAREALESNQYSGAAPVPLQQYVEVVRQQRPEKGWLTRAGLAKALRGMVITEQLLSQIGPAVSSANSLLLYGKPGDGKTFLIESLNNLQTAPVFVPYALECQGNIVQVYDPVYHQRVSDEEGPIVAAIARETTYDHRWVKCRRPFIVSGGELTLDMLDLRFNETSKLYEAPFQLKANNGIYLIDDFGRQRAAPAEVLNRWIVPMERRIDYLSFVTGGKMPVPFEAFLVFSTNLKPGDLGDEAFLRRIHYKMLLRGPGKNEFVRIFERFCAANDLPYDQTAVEEFIQSCYVGPGKAFRRCQPRDVLTHAINLIEFEGLPKELSADLLRRAFASCFVQDEEDGPPAETEVVRADPQACTEYWSTRALEITTTFGRLAMLASFRNSETKTYRPPANEGEFSDSDVDAVLARLHLRTLHDWLRLSLEQQCDDVAGYLATPEGRAAFLSFDRRELAGILLPPGAQPEEAALFREDLGTILMLVCHRAQAATPVAETRERLEKIA